MSIRERLIIAEENHIFAGISYLNCHNAIELVANITVVSIYHIALLWGVETSLLG